MSTHPNAMLLLVLTPDDLTRKTMRAIVADAGGDADDDSPKVKIGDEDYCVTVMEEEYDESYQISAKEGDIVLHDFLTYGYGEKLAWAEVVDRVAALQAWADVARDKYRCSAAIYVSANYW